MLVSRIAIYRPLPTEPKNKPLLVGESNPYGSDPQYALYPAPDGCSGHRLCCLILRMSRINYLKTFDRVNLCDGDWCLRDAKNQALNLFHSPEQRLILFGAKVATAFGIKFRPYCQENESILMLPHPSGRNFMWNEPGAFRRAREAVAAYVPEVAHLLGMEGDE